MKTTTITTTTKAILAYFLLSSLASAAPAAPSPGLKVHEWGTFTVLEGSDGQVVPWHQSAENLVELPPFVDRMLRFSGKSGTGRWASNGRRTDLDTVRMETPVVYFYPAQEMNVSVTAAFAEGRITEWFPPAFSMNSKEITWKGKLLPPNSSARDLVPAAPGSQGRHYAAARAVPDAWLFRGEAGPQLPNNLIPLVANGVPPVNGEVSLHQSAKTKAAPVDHFIFYRGAGSQGNFPIQVRQNAQNDYTLMNVHELTIPRLLALKVSQGQSSWAMLRDLQRMEYSAEQRVNLNSQSLKFPEPAGKAVEVAGKLRVVMMEALTAAGLTTAEAAAMVATWDDLWFTEPGTRVLAILPQPLAEQMVSLNIEPKPSETTRVFVARIELMSQSQEEALQKLIMAAPSPAAQAEFQALELGRFGEGGLERAITLMDRKMYSHFSALATKPD